MIGNERLKKIAILSGIVLFIMALLSLTVPENQFWKQQKDIKNEQDDQQLSQAPTLPISPTNPEQIPVFPTDVWSKIPKVAGSIVYEELRDSDYTAILLEKESLGKNPNIILEDLAVDRCIKITLEGSLASSYNGNIYRVRGSKLFQNEIPTPSPSPLPTPTPIQASSTITPTIFDISITPTLTPIPSISSDPIISASLQTDELSTVLTIWLDRTYVYEQREDEFYYYLLLRRPKDIYPKIIVVDAGHGGRDSGTYSKDYSYWEKDINLNVLLELKKLLDAQEEIKVYYTRTEDRRLTLNQRVNLANDLEADLFLSIHCNSNPSTSVHGTEVLFNEKQDSIQGFNSRKFALICAEEVCAQFGLTNRGIIPRSSNVHIIGAAKMPVALIEMAYMTNRSDLKVLVNPERQSAVALGIYHAVLKAYEQLKMEES